MRLSGEERKLQIIEAAINAFSTYGYEKTSIAIVCEMSGIARGTLYQYFKNKRSLFRELIEVYANRIQSYMQPISIGQQENPLPEDLLNKRHQLIFNEILNNKPIYKILLREAQTKNAEVEDIIFHVFESFTQLIKEEIDMVIQLGHYNTIDSQFAAVWILGGIRGIIENYIIDSDSPPSLEVLAEKATALALPALLRK